MFSLPTWARRWFWKWMRRLACVFVMYAAVMRAGWVSPLLGAVQSVARASEATTVAAGAIATAGANVTVSFANFAVEAVGSSLTLSEELWRGIDLRHVNITRTIGRVAAPDSKLLSEWILDGANGLVMEGYNERMALAVANLSEARPVAETSSEFFSSDGSWEGWSISAKALPSGYVGAVITTLHAEFQVEWANPMWEALGVDPHREAERIAASIRRVVSTLEAPPPAALKISDASLGTSAMPVLQRQARTSSFDPSSVLLAVAIVVASWWHRPIPPPPVTQEEIGEDEQFMPHHSPAPSFGSIIEQHHHLHESVPLEAVLSPERRVFGPLPGSEVASVIDSVSAAGSQAPSEGGNEGFVVVAAA